MADMINNTLIVSGQQADLDRFAAERCSPLGMIDFALILPVYGNSDPLDVLDKAVDMIGGMSHNEALADTWGTRSNPARYHEAECEDEEVACSKGQILFKFRTAWSPPLKVIEAAARQYPELEFELNYFGEAGTEHEEGNKVTFPLTWQDDSDLF